MCIRDRNDTTQLCTSIMATKPNEVSITAVTGAGEDVTTLAIAKFILEEVKEVKKSNTAERKTKVWGIGNNINIDLKIAKSSNPVAHNSTLFEPLAVKNNNEVTYLQSITGTSQYI